jgi:leader peptidase (prepilin peptidase)/N-methyltransferase
MEHALDGPRRSAVAPQSTPLAAAAAGALALALAGVGDLTDPLAATRLVVLGGALGVVTLSDVREHRIPNRVVLPAAVICLVLSLAGGGQLDASLVVGAALVVLLCCLSLAAPVVLGMGDVKLALLILCGLWSLAPVALIAAIELYAGVGMVLLVRRGRTALGGSLPLAPITAAGSVIALMT